MWDPKTVTVLQTLQAHSCWISSLSFSPDGEQLVSRSWENTVQLWDLKIGKSLKVFHAKHPITKISLPPLRLCVETTNGQKQFTSASGYVQKITPPSNGWSIEQGWLKWNSSRTLKFSPDFELSVLARHKNLFAMMDKFNRVNILELHSEFDPSA